MVQRRLEAFYRLEATPHIGDFVQVGDGKERERVLLREGSDHVELRVELPPCSLAAARQHAQPSDAYLQVVEGVSHFVHLAERIRTGLPTTQLELELQAEVDKLVALAFSVPANRWQELSAVHRKLYGNVTYLHGAETEAGARYRMANDLAARLTARLLTGPSRMREVLREFYRASLRGKIHLAQAA